MKLLSFYSGLLIIIFYSTIVNAQNFNGGNGDGYSASNIVNTNFNTLPEVFTVTLNSHVSQPDPVNIFPVTFSVEFNRPPVDFTFDDIVWTGTANGISGNISGTGSSYTVNISGLTVEGTIVASIPLNSVHDAGGTGNQASVSSDNSVFYETVKPAVEIMQAIGQSDPTLNTPVNFTARFSEPVIGFENSDVSFGGSANPSIVSVSGTGPEYNIAISGMTGDGIVAISIKNGVCSDLAGNLNTSSLNTDSAVQFQVSNLTVSIDQDIAQADPTNQKAIVFVVEFNRDVNGFSFDDITWSGTATGVSGTISGTGSSYLVHVTNILTEGTLIANIQASKVFDNLLVGNQPSSSTDNSVTYDITRPGIEILAEPGQNNPTNNSTISFRANFTEHTLGFVPSNVTISGTAGANTINLRGGPINYTIDVSGMTNSGTVSVSIEENLTTDSAGNLNTKSINTDNTVVYDNVKPNVVVSSNESSPTSLIQIPVHFEFSKGVSGFDVSDINISNGSINSLIETVEGRQWDALIIPAASGIINIEVPANAAIDSSGNNNNASNHFQIEYIAEDHLKFEANNIFTPNSNLNRYWIIKNVEQYIDYDLVIRNVTGLVVYQTTNYQNDWNGTFKNKQLPTGTYYYTFSNPSKEIVYKGFINIIYE